MHESVEESQQHIADIPKHQLLGSMLRRFDGTGGFTISISLDDIQIRNLTQLGRVKKHQREEHRDYETRFLMRKERQQGDWNNERECHQAYNALQTW